MHAMNYRITLPADYDMGIVHRRVAAKGHLLDGFPGLGLKAYLVRERGTDGSPVNEYAPFYLWNTPEGMNSFLWGPGFQGLVADFGRPTVEHWAGLAFERGAAVGAVPLSASRRVHRLDPAADPAPVLADEVRALAEQAAAPGVHSAALAVDPRHWEVVRFTLWQDTAPPEPGTDRYRVLHLSRPGLDALPAGRQW
ncbi:DUF4865 family protein [Actinacidiphila rubida]|uniref:DUF4865 domain-containing protein n=1 Tax=Actinacidiphila rubida TaxID=310780 RepID=A0A1H8QCS6_9ACTN|nr:DUF4865 family protein [Actinacidiphila rubida]SEO51846.1 protein of unknown function [Actinacidiphila rubida]